MQHTLRWGLPYVTKYKGRLIFGFIVNTLIGLAALINPYFAGRIVADVIQGGQNHLLMQYLTIMLANTVIRSIARYWFRVLCEETSQKILFELRRDVYHKLHIQNFTWFDKTRVGDTMSRMTGDLEAIRGFIAFDIFAIPESIILYLSAIIVMGLINVPLTISMIILAPIVMIAAYKQGKEIRPAFKEIREQFAHLNSVCEENIGGNRVVKAFTKESHEIEKFTQANQAFYDSNTKTAEIRVKYMPIMETCAALLPLILLLFGSLLVIGGYIELWQIITLSGYLWMLDNPTRMFSAYVNNMQNFVTSLEKVHEMIRHKVYITAPNEPVDLPADHSTIEGNVEFRNVGFSYDIFADQPYILKDISFTAKKGETIGIVGGTGAGKTALINLIARFYDVQEGAVLIDGVNVKDYRPEDLRRGISYAMQDVFLYSDTVEGNIAYGVPNAPMDAVYAAAAISDADGFVRHMPESYDTIVGERGVGLSGGQKQRLSLARAVATEPKILILDDVTSAVDMETEHRIQAALAEKVMKSGGGPTTFIVAHRLSAVKNADFIIVLGDGKIVERGTHEELLATNGYYAQLYEEQRGTK